MKKKILLLLSTLLLMSSLYSQEKNDINVVCSTSWVAAIAELAGIDDVKTIAPSNLKHPPEFEITAEDIVNVIQADLILHAGYEKMVKVMTASSDISQDKMQKVKTTNTLWNLENMVNLLSKKANTEDIANKRFSNYKKMIEKARQEIIEKKLNTIEIYVHKDQAELAKDLGLNVKAIFGSGPLSADEIALAAKEEFAIVIDNYHNPVADPIKSVSPDTKIIVWRNFPDYIGNNALYNIVNENINNLLN